MTTAYPDQLANWIAAARLSPDASNVHYCANGESVIYLDSSDIHGVSATLRTNGAVGGDLVDDFARLAVVAKPAILAYAAEVERLKAAVEPLTDAERQLLADICLADPDDAAVLAGLLSRLGVGAEQEADIVKPMVKIAALKELVEKLTAAVEAAADYIEVRGTENAKFWSLYDAALQPVEG